MGSEGAIRPASTRVSIARLAEAVIAADPGVSPTPGQGRWLTPDGEKVIPGVVVGATADGRVDVQLHLVGAWPPQPLPETVSRLQQQLTEAAVAVGIGERLGRIDVSIHDFAEPAEGGVEV